jgi:hypothetical protein
MPARQSKKKLDVDLITNQSAADAPANGSAGTEPAPEPSPPAKNPAAVALGKLGGAKGGAARAKKLTAEKRREIAKKGAAARWAKKKS